MPLLLSTSITSPPISWLATSTAMVVRANVLIPADAGKHEKRPQQPGISVHQRTVEASSLNPAIPCLAARC
jgi:hypothetical protein